MKKQIHMQNNNDEKIEDIFSKKLKKMYYDNEIKTNNGIEKEKSINEFKNCLVMLINKWNRKLKIMILNKLYYFIFIKYYKYFMILIYNILIIFQISNLINNNIL